MEKEEGINTFGRSEFLEGMYPMIALGGISSMVGWTQSVFSSSANSRDWINWVLLGTSENFT